MGFLTIQFQGICTHFWNGVLPGIPHRVVLVDGTPLRGLAVVPPGGTATKVWLLPHLPILYLAADLGSSGSTFNQPPLFQANTEGHGVGYLAIPSRVTISNSIPDPDDPNQTPNHVNYPPPPPLVPTFLDHVLSVTTFADHYSYSSDVVLGGNASAYLDLFNGTVVAVKDPDTQLIYVEATVATDGDPNIQVSALGNDPQNPILDQNYQVPSGSRLFVSNLCYFDNSETNDWLLHLLTDRGGIPRLVNDSNLKPPPLSPQQALQDLITNGFPMNFEPSWPPPGGGGPNDSCADSRYP